MGAGELSVSAVPGPWSRFNSEVPLGMREILFSTPAHPWDISSCVLVSSEVQSRVKALGGRLFHLIVHFIAEFLAANSA